MSKSKSDTVVVSRETKTQRHYHVSETCFNYPDRAKEVDRGIAEDWYAPCGICTDESHPDQHEANTAEYECLDCGTIDRHGVTGSRVLWACEECADVTTWERTDE